jgi:hypothetical protein
MTQLTIEEAIAERDRQLERVNTHASDDWKDQALAAVRRTCEQLPDFISDDIWRVGDLPSTREDRALGPVMRKAAGLGWCERTMHGRPSARSHGAAKPVWVSRLYTGQRSAAA